MNGLHIGTFYACQGFPGKKSSNLDFDPSFDALFVDRTAVDLGILFFGVGNGDASKERTTNQGMMSCHTNPRSLPTQLPFLSGKDYEREDPKTD